MKHVQYAIVSEEMVWLWFYDELGSKHIKELLGYDARVFIRALDPAKPDDRIPSGGTTVNASM